MTLDRRKPIDHAFIEGMRDRIEVANVIDKLQNHVRDEEKHPLSMTQLKAADILLRKCMPDLKAIEHTDKPSRPATREELLEQLAALHAAATAKSNAGTTAPGFAADSTTPVSH
jgi:hypothetical protein